MTARAGSERPTETASSGLSPISPGGNTTSYAKPKTSNPDDPFAQGLRQSYHELDAERRATLAAIGELDTVAQATPVPPSAEDAGLLDLLPNLTLNLAEAPEQLLRSLFEATNLTIQLHPDSDEATITIRLPADELYQIANAAERITNTMTTVQVPGQRTTDTCTDVVRAPGAIRTASAQTRTRRELHISATVEIPRRHRRSGGEAK